MWFLVFLRPQIYVERNTRLIILGVSSRTSSPATSTLIFHVLHRRQHAYTPTPRHTPAYLSGKRWVTSTQKTPNRYSVISSGCKLRQLIIQQTIIQLRYHFPFLTPVIAPCGWQMSPPRLSQKNFQKTSLINHNRCRCRYSEVPLFMERMKRKGGGNGGWREYYTRDRCDNVLEVQRGVRTRNHETHTDSLLISSCTRPPDFSGDR